MEARIEKDGGERPYLDPVIEAYKKDVDRTLIRHNLQRTVQQRADALVDLMRSIEEMNRAGKAAREARRARQAG